MLKEAIESDVVREKVGERFWDVLAEGGKEERSKKILFLKALLLE